MKIDLVDKEIILKEFLIFSVLTVLTFFIAPNTILGGLVFYFLYIYIFYTIMRSIYSLKTIALKFLGIIVSLLVTSVIYYFMFSKVFFAYFFFRLFYLLFI
jgi:hypothetical protein